MKQTCPNCEEEVSQLWSCDHCGGKVCDDCLYSTGYEWRGVRVDGPDICEVCYDRTMVSKP
jgi:hypothetical protein